MGPTPARLAIDESADGNVLVLHGDLDSHTASVLEERLRGIGSNRDVVLDLGDVAFIDSSGFRVILAGHGAFEERNTRLILRSASAAVMRLLDITGLEEHLHLEP